VVPEEDVVAVIVVDVVEDEVAIVEEIRKSMVRVAMVGSIRWREAPAVTRKLVEAIVDRVEAAPFLVVDDDLEVPRYVSGFLFFSLLVSFLSFPKQDSIFLK
jgi:hypothetical protein